MSFLEEFRKKLRNRAPRWPTARRRFVILGINHHTPPWPFAIALGEKIRFLPQSQMHNSPLSRRHRREVIRRAGSSDIFSRNGSRHTQLLQTNRPLILAI